MSRPAYKPGDNLSLFTAADDPALVSTQFWVQLLRYRPILLLGSLWLGLICVAAVAYSRLMFAGVPPSALDSAPPAATQSRSSDRQSRSGLSSVAPVTPRATDQVETAGSDGTAEMDGTAGAEAVAAVPTEVTNGGFPAWSLGAVVGLCALGCFLMQRRFTAPARPRKKRANEPTQTLPRGLKTATVKRPSKLSRARVQAAKKPAEPKRLAPFSPGRDQIVVPNRSPLPPSLELTANRSAGPKLAPISAQVMGQSSPAPALAQEQSAPASPEVTVVSPQESVALDWPEGSLAHSLDIRQRRSLSSFM
ncbi:MAG: hypothetical protein ICV77_01010 [Cyanobacteria bacterium Co-bin8]|nr:hypothetical protein [Cyanobacteria bacterium Co-bin8]